MKKLLAATALLASLAAPALAGDKDAYLTGSVGLFNFNEHENSDVAGLGGLEYRGAVWDYGIRPTLGVSVDTDGDLYGYGGFNWDIKLGNPWTLTPNFAIGLYNHSDDGYDLGGAIEFRSGIELGYTLANQHRIGVAVNHMSNASIYDENPGTENLIFTYSLPINRLFGK